MNDTRTSRGLDAADFRHILGHSPPGVPVITPAHDDGSPAAGMVVGTFTSVSLDPPLVAFLPDKKSSSWPQIKETGRFCVNVLGADQEALCRQFSARGGDKFEGVAWRPSPSRNPILEGIVAWVDCTIEQEADDSSPLTFHRGRFGQVGAAQDRADADHSNEIRLLAASLFDQSYANEYQEDISRLATQYLDGDEHTVESRSELVLKFLVDYLAHLVERYRAARRHDDPVERLSDMIKATLHANRDHRAAAILYQSQRHTLIDVDTAELVAAELSMQDLWLEALEQGISTGQLRDADPKISYFLMRDALFLVARWFREGGKLSLEEVAQEYAVRFLHGLSTEGRQGGSRACDGAPEALAPDPRARRDRLGGAESAAGDRRSGSGDH